MASIKAAIQKNQQRIAAGGETKTGLGPQPPQTPLVVAPSPQLDLPLGGGLPQRGTYPASLILGGDINDSNRMYRGAGMRSTTFPNAPVQTVTKNTTVVQAAVATSAAAAVLSIQVNGAPTPVQSVLDLIAGTSIILTPDLSGGITIDAASGGSDGLTHGTLPWESDPGYIIFRDDFLPFLNTSTFGTAPTSQIGQLGWILNGTKGSESGILGGVPPYVGQYYWSNPASASQAAFLNLVSNGQSTSQFSGNGMALFENPGWIMSFVFKLDGSLDSNLNFSTAQKSIYIGLIGTEVATTFLGVPISRPDVFIGLRYDTSTSAPSIGDSFFTFEVVANPTGTSPTRNNTQGSTQVTSVAPAIGVWHRLDIICNTAGNVSLVLDGGTPFVAAVPTISFATTVTGFTASNGIARLNWTPGSSTPPISSWGAGTLLAVSGFGASRSTLNGSFTLSASDASDVWYDVAGAAALGSNTVTLSGFPAVIPSFSMGNDDTATPTVNNMNIMVDYWTFVWNPNLGSNAPGTPTPTLPRYF